MKCEEMIKEIYFVAGKLEGLSLYLQRNSSDAVVESLSDCVDRLEIVGAQLIQKDVRKYEEPVERFGRVYPGQEDARADQ